MISRLESPLAKSVAIVLILTGAYLSWMFGQRTLEHRAMVERATVLRDSISLLRRDAEMCQASVRQEEAEFRDLDAGMDSLRTGVESYEELNPEGRRGVQEEEYEQYIEAFDQYNDAVGDWQNRARRLSQRSALCRELFVQHNELVDTLCVLVDRLDEGG